MYTVYLKVETLNIVTETHGGFEKEQLMSTKKCYKRTTSPTMDRNPPIEVDKSNAVEIARKKANIWKRKTVLSVKENVKT